ncbi:MAG: prepilin-type N-terminal cleavage/methylation domain-containing protein [Deltaproteobacteria bacterium]|nr:prepilin-type N-terminal cleavage/methylation domain-containing protein [Deltaproteobacteria bacterium]MBI4197398.1 prepilin-type N-terminal cleavage/methylation domain-containing protein [Deltaproteobacteria bacterium]
MERINSKGFTLVELVLAMTLITIVVAVSGFLMGRGVDAYRLVTSRTETVHQARTALVRMQKELERLREVTHAAPDRIAFRDPNMVETDFRLEGGRLYRGNDILAEDITRLTFTYYRDNGNETEAAPQVRRIHLELVTESVEAGRLSLRTDVFPRNYLYDNFQ